MYQLKLCHLLLTNNQCNTNNYLPIVNAAHFLCSIFKDRAFAHGYLTVTGHGDHAVALYGADGGAAEGALCIVITHKKTATVNYNRDVEIFPVLQAIFKNIYGTTVVKFVNALRGEYAKTLMSSRKYTIAEIAHLSGFADEKYFSRVFSKRYGYPPSHFYRKLFL